MRQWTHVVFRYLPRVLVICVVALLALVMTALAEERPANPAIQEEVWAIPVTLPTIAYVVRPVGNGPFPLVVMNHGVSLDQRERGFFPLVEFRDAAMWFARRGYLVVAPSGPGYGAMALDEPERGIYSSFYSKIGSCDNPNFRDAGLAVALVDKWIIDYMTAQKLTVPDNAIVVGQSAGGWAAIALSSRNLPGVRAIITFAAGRGGRVGGKPNNNCAPDQLVAATGEPAAPARPPCSGSTSRTTRSLARPYQGECTKPIPGPAVTPSIICFLRSAVKDTTSSIRPMPFRCGRRWSGRSWTSTDKTAADNAMEAKDDKAPVPPVRPNMDQSLLAALPLLVSAC